MKIQLEMYMLYCASMIMYVWMAVDICPRAEYIFVLLIISQFAQPRTPILIYSLQFCHASIYFPSYSNVTPTPPVLVKQHVVVKQDPLRHPTFFVNIALYTPSSLNLSTAPTHSESPRKNLPTDNSLQYPRTFHRTHPQNLSHQPSLEVRPPISSSSPTIHHQLYRNVLRRRLHLLPG